MNKFTRYFPDYLDLVEYEKMHIVDASNAITRRTIRMLCIQSLQTCDKFEFNAIEIYRNLQKYKKEIHRKYYPGENFVLLYGDIKFERLKNLNSRLVRNTEKHILDIVDINDVFTVINEPLQFAILAVNSVRCSKPRLLSLFKIFSSTFDEQDTFSRDLIKHVELCFLAVNVERLFIDRNLENLIDKHSEKFDYRTKKEYHTFRVALQKAIFA